LDTIFPAYSTEGILEFYNQNFKRIYKKHGGIKMYYLDKRIIEDIFSQTLRNLPLNKENDSKYIY